MFGVAFFADCPHHATKAMDPPEAMPETRIDYREPECGRPSSPYSDWGSRRAALPAVAIGRKHNIVGGLSRWRGRLRSVLRQT